MSPRRAAGYVLVAATALVFGFLLAAQLRAQLITPTNAVARNQALVRTVQDLERQNADYRTQIASARSDVDSLQAQAAARSDAARRAQQQVDGLRQQTGLTPLHGPGVTVVLANGRAGATPAQGAWTVNFQDLEDVVQVLYAGGAEGVAVNGRRLTPASYFAGSGNEIVIDQGPPLASPFRVVAVGNRAQMEQLLSDPSYLGDLRNRQRLYGLQLAWSGSPDQSLQAFDGALAVAYARAP